jgi:hypothetical protein
METLGFFVVPNYLGSIAEKIGRRNRHDDLAQLASENAPLDRVVP